MTDQLTEAELEALAASDGIALCYIDDCKVSAMARELLACRRAGVALNWVRNDTPSGIEAYEAETQFGQYYVEEGNDNEGGWAWGLNGDYLVTEEGLRVHQAKAAAQAHYEARIRSCLVTPPPASRTDADLRAIPDGLIDALRSGRQADMDGVMVTVSRQACETAADILAALSTPRPDEGDGA